MKQYFSNFTEKIWSLQRCSVFLLLYIQNESKKKIEDNDNNNKNDNRKILSIENASTENNTCSIDSFVKTKVYFYSCEGFAESILFDSHCIAVYDFIPLAHLFSTVIHTPPLG